MGLLVQERVQAAEIGLGVATLTGALLAGRTLLGVVAAPLAGVLSDWAGDRWRVAAWGLSSGAVGLALLAGSAPVVILAGIALGAAAGGSLQSITTALTGDLVSQEQRGRAIGLLHTVGDLGSAVGPLIAYALLPWTGLDVVYLLCAGLFVAGVMLVLWSRSRDRQALR
jgi:MFS family permease